MRRNLGADFLDSKTLLNLDSEEEGALYVGCSGGKNTIAVLETRDRIGPPPGASPPS